MQKEKLAVIGLVVIIVAALSAYILTTEDVFENLFEDEGTKISISEGAIELGDCVDVNFIGKFVNGTVFESSYSDVENKTDGAPLNIFVSLNLTETPPEGYEIYSSQMIVEGFMEGLVGLEEGETSTIGPIPPEKAYGVKPKVGDIIDLTPLIPDLDITYVLKVIEIQEDVPMPSDYVAYYGPGLTTLYTLREDWHDIGEIIETSYVFWENSSAVTKINETLLWMYTTPTTELNENFTWSEVNVTTGTQTTYPENMSSVTTLTEDIIVVTCNPEINSEIVESVFTGIDYSDTIYLVENMTADKINTSITDSTGNKTYKEFDRTITIQRNETQNITMDPFPGELLEEQLFLYVRAIDSDFKLSYSDFAGETLNYEVTIEKVYKTSQ